MSRYACMAEKVGTHERLGGEIVEVQCDLAKNHDGRHLAVLSDEVVVTWLT